jgi:chromosome segregation ATPase
VPEYPLAEVAERLGTTTEAVRARVKRGSLEGFRDNHGRWRVRLPDDQTADRTASGEASSHVSAQGNGASGHDQTVSELRERIARLEGKLEGTEARLSDRDRELGEVKAERDRLLTMLTELQTALTRRSEGTLTRLWDRLFGTVTQRRFPAAP